MKSDMRVVLTKRLLREGMFRLLAEKPISKITVTDLCKESGINRATFYNHYDMPVMILREVAREYAADMRKIYEDHVRTTKDNLGALEASLTYVYERKAEVKLLLSPNAENYISGFGLEIMNETVSRSRIPSNARTKKDRDDYYLRAVMTSSAAFGLIDIWIVKDFRKTPRDIATLLYDVFGDKMFY